MRDGADWFTDKMPLNETHLGLIGLIFPQAPIIHVLRHPLDVVSFRLLQPSDARLPLRLRPDEHRSALRARDAIWSSNIGAKRRFRYMAVRYEDVIDRPGGAGARYARLSSARTMIRAVSIFTKTSGTPAGRATRK